MTTWRRVTGYDLFKLIVAISLLLLFLLLNRKTTPNAPLPVVTQFSNENASPDTASLTQMLQTSTPFTSPTTTGLSSATPTPQLTLTPTGTAQLTATPLPSPTPASLPQPKVTPLPSPASTVIPPTLQPGPDAASACEATLSQSRLRIGGKAVIVRRLNFRSSPGIQANWLRTNLAGTKVEVMDGPQCIPYVNGAYIWWQIKLPDGQIGWSAEASQFGSFYFMEPEQ